QLRRPPRKPKLTTTLHDLTTWILPECHTPAVVAADKDFAERVLKRADGTIEPRKNVDTLLTAWEGMPEDFRRRYDLVIAGMAGWRSEGTMNRLLQAKRDNKSIRYHGYVPETDMPALTAGAFAFVYPSLYEGFGIPVAQAMAAGRPVITSNISSLPEVAGDAALLVDPKSAAQLAGAFLKMAESPGLSEQLGVAGAASARRYSWARAAELSLNFFRSVS